MAQLTGQGMIIAGATNTSNPLSQTSPNPGANPPLGTRMVDNLGNVYVLCDATSTMFSSQPVVIFDDNTCNALTTAQGRGRVGICCANATSDNLVWVQVYGRALMMLGGSGASPSDAANGPTSLNTSAATKFVVDTSLSSPASLAWVTDASSANNGVVIGLWVASDASLDVSAAVTSATSHTGNSIGVFMNFPYIQTGDYVS